MESADPTSPWSPMSGFGGGKDEVLELVLVREVSVRFVGVVWRMRACTIRPSSGRLTPKTSFSSKWRLVTSAAWNATRK